VVLAETPACGRRGPARPGMARADPLAWFDACLASRSRRWASAWPVTGRTWVF